MLLLCCSFCSPYSTVVLLSHPQQGKLTIKADLIFDEYSKNQYCSGSSANPLGLSNTLAPLYTFFKCFFVQLALISTENCN